MKALLAASIALLVACGSVASPSAAPSPLPTVGVAPSATPAPARLPGSVVRVAVDGVEYPYGSHVTVEPGGATTVALTFPFAMDRASVERWLPRKATLRWTDDRTVELRFAESEQYLGGFKVAETLSADGAVAIDFFIVDVSYPPGHVVSVYAVADVLQGWWGAKPAASWRVSTTNAIRVSPDATRALLFNDPAEAAPAPSAALRYRSGPAPRVLELATGTARDVALAPADDGSFAFGGWIAGGKLLLVGAGVWLGAGDGSGMKLVADAARVGRRPAVAAPSPRGTYVATATPDGISVVDLRDGSVRRLTQPGVCEPSAFSRLAWSADERLLAWTDCTGTAPGARRVRIVDAGADRTVRLIDGNGVEPLLTGDLLVLRSSGESGEGMRTLGVVMGFDGVEKARYLGYDWSLSRDGRYLLYVGSCCAGGPSSSLADLTLGPDPRGGVPGIASWTDDGRIVTIE